MEEFKSFFKDKGLNEKVETGEVEVKPFVKALAKTRHGAYADKLKRSEYQKRWIMAKRLVLSKVEGRRISGKG